MNTIFNTTEEAPLLDRIAGRVLATAAAGLVLGFVFVALWAAIEMFFAL